MAHHPITLLVGPEDCFDRDCDQYLTADGEDDPGVERCSHIREEIVCEECSTEQSDGSYGPTVAWPCAEADEGAQP